MRLMEKRYGKTVLIATLVGFVVMFVLAIAVAKHPVYINSGENTVTSVVTTGTTKKTSTTKGIQTTTKISSGKIQIINKIKEAKKKVNPETDGIPETTTSRIDKIKSECSKKTSMVGQRITDKIKSVCSKESKTSTTTSAQSYTPEQFRKSGVIYYGGYKYTWYSEKVLPGKGLNIPSRYSDGNFVRDGDGYIVLASSDLSKGTVVDTPFGKGKVYDTGCPSGVVDVYTSW